LVRLADDIREVVLRGSGFEAIEFSYFNDRGASSRKRHPFEGILNNMQRRYRETESNAVREELSRYISSQACPDCHGTRLNEGRAQRVRRRACAAVDHRDGGRAQPGLLRRALDLPGKQGKIAEKIVKEINDRLRFLVNVGLNYLTLDRSAETLSGGEAQRIRLASQIGAGLVGVMYVLDEPSIGLHQRDNERLLKTLTYLRDLGNTVIVVEHDEDAIRSADHIVDIGPGAGRARRPRSSHRGRRRDLRTEESITGHYLSGREIIAIPDQRHPVDRKKLLKIDGAAATTSKRSSWRSRPGCSPA
jgi:excinuclease ABC subunit A